MYSISDDPLYVGAMPCAPILTLRCSIDSVFWGLYNLALVWCTHVVRMEQICLYMIPNKLSFPYKRVVSELGARCLNKVAVQNNTGRYTRTKARQKLREIPCKMPDQKYFEKWDPRPAPAYGARPPPPRPLDGSAI